MIITLNDDILSDRLLTFYVESISGLQNPLAGWLRHHNFIIRSYCIQINCSKTILTHLVVKMIVTHSSQSNYNNAADDNDNNDIDTNDNSINDNIDNDGDDDDDGDGGRWWQVVVVVVVITATMMIIWFRICSLSHAPNKKHQILFQHAHRLIFPFLLTDIWIIVP